VSSDRPALKILWREWFPTIRDRQPCEGFAPHVPLDFRPTLLKQRICGVCIVAAQRVHTSQRRGSRTSNRNRRQHVTRIRCQRPTRPTPRDQEVMRLVATDVTNPEMAHDRLFQVVCTSNEVVCTSDEPPRMRLRAGEGRDRDPDPGTTGTPGRACAPSTEGRQRPCNNAPVEATRRATPSP
jgi:hypothetical protein